MRGWPGGLSLAVPPRVTPSELPYLAGSAGLWAGGGARGWESRRKMRGAGSEEAGRPRQRGGDRGWAAPSRSDPFHSPRKADAVSSVTPLSGGGRGRKGKLAPFCLKKKKKKKSKGRSRAALQPPSPHSWTMHPSIFLLGHGRGLDFLS